MYIHSFDFFSDVTSRMFNRKKGEASRKGEDRMTHKETPSDKRERLRQQELRKNPGGSLKGQGLQDISGGMGWKGTALLFVVLIIGALLYLYFFD